MLVIYLFTFVNYSLSWVYLDVVRELSIPRSWRPDEEANVPIAADLIE